jgi:hypothetical protein
LQENVSYHVHTSLSFKNPRKLLFLQKKNHNLLALLYITKK